jgi:hypothetical protein
MLNVINNEKNSGTLHNIYTVIAFSLIKINVSEQHHEWYYYFLYLNRFDINQKLIEIFLISLL